MAYNGDVARRSLKLGERKVELEQPDDLFVVRMRGKIPRSPHDRAVARWDDGVLRLAGDSEVPEDMRELWRSAGWTLVRLVRGEDGSGVPEPVIVAPIFRTEEGSWWIGTDRLTVRLSGDVTDERAEELLRECGLEVLRKLGFGRHVFEVRVPPEHEVLSVVDRLTLRREVQYAEPQFIESLGPR